MSTIRAAFLSFKEYYFLHFLYNNDDYNGGSGDDDSEDDARDCRCSAANEHLLYFQPLKKSCPQHQHPQQ